MNYQENFYNSSNIIILIVLSFLTLSISLVGLVYEPLVILARAMAYSAVVFLIIF